MALQSYEGYLEDGNFSTPLPKSGRYKVIVTVLEEPEEQTMSLEEWFAGLEAVKKEAKEEAEEQKMSHEEWLAKMDEAFELAKDEELPDAYFQRPPRVPIVPLDLMLEEAV